MFQCRKCPYFKKEENKYIGGSMLVGFCKLRDQGISEMSITQAACKDRAVVNMKSVREATEQEASHSRLVTKKVDKENMVVF